MAVVIFGFTALGCEGTGCIKPSEHRFCLASTINAASCPDDENALAIAAFHLNALKNILITTLEVAGATVLLNFLLVSLTIFVAVLVLRQSEPRLTLIPQDWRGNSPGKFLKISRQFRQWLALLEHSPTNF